MPWIHEFMYAVIHMTCCHPWRTHDSHWRGLFHLKQPSKAQPSTVQALHGINPCWIKSKTSRSLNSLLNSELVRTWLTITWPTSVHYYHPQITHTHVWDNRCHLAEAFIQSDVQSCVHTFFIWVAPVGNKPPDPGGASTMLYLRHKEDPLKG